ncbi:unnamed protein product [Heligmosomoides polygyrus]|uniref:RRM domain-containing protein n=1 Tax=Heligmosomoides polygyrus TaxID=6339 RepID=A0A183GUM2_HELPZ|nr:unnamed protein product [Heligmosomoides polygyrus]
MKIFERIVNGRIRDIVQLSSNQCSFVAGCGTVDAVHAARLLIGKHREKQKPVHIAFLELEKAFDRVPREVIWYALRHHGFPEELIEWVRILYSCPKSRVQAATGTSMKFPISVGNCAYCFVEFDTADEAHDAMLIANGHRIPNSEPRSRFNLSFANDPRVPNRDGSSRCLGFIRFGDQTEQQKALVEMNKTVVRGREIILKLAAAKQRLPRHQIREGMQPHLIVDPSMTPYNQMATTFQQQQQQPQPQPQVAYTYQQPAAAPVATPPAVVVPVQAPELVYPYNPTAEEANAELIENGDAWWEVLEESRYCAVFLRLFLP